MPIIGKLDVADIKTAHIMKILSPIWSTKNETAGRLPFRSLCSFRRAALDGERIRSMIGVRRKGRPLAMTTYAEKQLKEWKAIYAPAQTEQMAGILSRRDLNLLRALIDDFTLMRMIPVSCHDAIEDRIDRRLKRWQRAQARQDRERQLGSRQFKKRIRA
jgi:hypothetical protein